MDYLAAILATVAALFFTMKLFGALDWPWVWVLAPVWIPLALMGVVFILMIVTLIIKGIITFW